jgi:hypothetical protein
MQQVLPGRIARPAMEILQLGFEIAPVIGVRTPGQQGMNFITFVTAQQVKQQQSFRNSIASISIGTQALAVI